MFGRNRGGKSLRKEDALTIGWCRHDLSRKAGEFAATDRRRVVEWRNYEGFAGWQLKCFKSGFLLDTLECAAFQTVTICSFSPMNDVALWLITPLGKRWKLYSTESTTTVWPALLPPCKKTQPILGARHLHHLPCSPLSPLPPENQPFALLFLKKIFLTTFTEKNGCCLK